jgi:putative ABC transport system permease protein
MSFDARVSRRICSRIIALASPLVPRWRRAEWREEWESEVWHESNRLAESGGLGGGGAVRLAVRCLGTFPHAAHLRAADWSSDMMMQDLRYALRTLLRKPVFALTTVLTLALGIGGNTAIFSIVNAVLLNPLPYPEPERLVWGNGVFSQNNAASVSPPDFVDYRAQNQVFEELAASTFGARSMTVTGGDSPEAVGVASVSANYLAALGLKPALGRSFTTEEEAAAQATVVMISYDLWQRRYGGDPGVLGQTIELDARPNTIVGVLPKGLRFPRGSEVWMPITLADQDFQMRAAHFLRLIGRLRPGVTIERAQADVDVIAQRLEAAYPNSNMTWRLGLLPLREQLVGNARPALLILLGAVGVVLLIACANVANLLLARASSRQGEIAVRAALGASRMRVLRQLVTEALLLSCLSALVGLVLAYLTLRGLPRFAPANLPRLEEIRLDLTVLGFTAALAVVVGLAFGLFPALQLSRAGVAERLRQAGRGREGGGARMRGVLVVTEVALSVVLLISSALLIRSFDRLRGEDPGFATDGAVVARILLPIGRYADPESRARRQEEVERGIASLRGVVAVGAINALPLVEFSGDTRVYAARRPPESNADWRYAQIREVTEGYFDAMSIPFVRGRGYNASDRGQPMRTVVINESLAREFFPGEDAVGQRLAIGFGPASGGTWIPPLEVIGVVRDVRQFTLGNPPGAEFYLLFSQSGNSAGMTVVARTSGNARRFVGPIREAVRSVDSEQPLARLEPLDAALDSTVSNPRFQSLLLSAFAGLALVLAALGVYGVLAYAVAQRAREIGIRMALGAGAGDVVRMVVARGLLLTGVGLGLGLLGALAATNFLENQLYEIGPRDRVAFATAPLVLATVALFASWLPARRAARLNPSLALREE